MLSSLTATASWNAIIHRLNLRESHARFRCGNAAIVLCQAIGLLGGEQELGSVKFQTELADGLCLILHLNVQIANRQLILRELNNLQQLFGM